MPRGKSEFKTMDNMETNPNMRVSPIVNMNNMDVPQMREMNPNGSVIPPLQDLVDSIEVKELDDDIECKFMSSSSDIHGGLFVPDQIGSEDVEIKMARQLGEGIWNIGKKLVKPLAKTEKKVSPVAAPLTRGRSANIAYQEAMNPKKRALRGLRHGTFGTGKEYNDELVVKELDDDIEIKGTFGRYATGIGAGAITGYLAGGTVGYKRQAHERGRELAKTYLNEYDKKKKKIKPSATIKSKGVGSKLIKYGGSAVAGIGTGALAYGPGKKYGKRKVDETFEKHGKQLHENVRRAATAHRRRGAYLNLDRRGATIYTPPTEEGLRKMREYAAGKGHENVQIKELSDDIETKNMANLNFASTMQRRNIMRPPAMAKMGKPSQPNRGMLGQRSQGNPMSARSMTPPEKPINAPIAKNIMTGEDVIEKGVGNYVGRVAKKIVQSGKRPGQNALQKVSKTKSEYRIPYNKGQLPQKNKARKEYYNKLMSNPDATGNLGYANRNEALLGGVRGFKLREYTGEIEEKAMALNIAKHVALPAGTGLVASILGGDIANRIQDRRNKPNLVDRKYRQRKK